MTPLILEFSHKGGLRGASGLEDMPEGVGAHIHVAEGNPAPSVAKIWITRAGHCYLRSNSLRIPERALRNIMRLLESHQEEIVEVNRKQQLGGDQAAVSV